jgi:hypothetical protein
MSCIKNAVSHRGSQKEFLKKLVLQKINRHFLAQSVFFFFFINYTPVKTGINVSTNPPEC